MYIHEAWEYMIGDIKEILHGTSKTETGYRSKEQ